MKNLFIYLLVLGMTLSMQCTKSFLDEETPNEVPVEDIDASIVEGLVNAAYAPLNGQIDDEGNAFNSPGSNWSFGDVTSDNYYKGGGGTGDQTAIGKMETYAVGASDVDIQRKFLALYEGVNRTITAELAIKNTGLLDANTSTQRIAELKFLRGHYYFELKKIYGNIALLPTNESNIAFTEISNKDFTSDQVWDTIISLFNEAKNILPKVQLQEDKARPTYYAAVAYLAKVALFRKDYPTVIANCDTIINSNLFALFNDFAGLFQVENEHCNEIIFAVEQVINDGTLNSWRGSAGDRLFPPGGPYASYGFLRPSRNMLNAYRTIGGLPVHDTNIVNPADSVTLIDSVDPRLDMTIGRPGVPYFDVGTYEADWARDPATYGIYGPKKRLLSVNSPYMLAAWPYVNALNFYVIRYADVLLWKAEAVLMSGGNVDDAIGLINDVRSRVATNPTTWIQKGINGTGGPAAAYAISTYPLGMTVEDAKIALKTERRLEFAGEGTRFFDLVRWGDAPTVLNQYVTDEAAIAKYLSGAYFTPGKNELMPIPQTQVDAGWIQNPGY